MKYTFKSEETANTILELRLFFRATFPIPKTEGEIYEKAIREVIKT